MTDAQPQSAPQKGSWKRFVGGFFLVYLVVSVLLNIALGPSGMSKNYLKEYKLDQDRYIETTKLDAYKRWSQRPELNSPDEDLAERIAFISEYTARPEYVAEQRRRTAYGLLADLFNVAMVIILVVHFARKPVGALVSDMIEGVRATMDRVRDQRADAAKLKQDAQAKLDGLPTQETELHEQTTGRIEDMRRTDALTVGQRISNLNKETQDRCAHEETLARLELKRALVDQALDVLAERYRAQMAPDEHAALIDQFVEQLEEGR